MNSVAEPLAVSCGEPPLALLAADLDALLGEDLDELELTAGSSSSVCILKNRIGAFDLSEPTRTEAFPYATLTSHRACGPWWWEVTSDPRSFLSQDTYRGSEVSPPSTHRYVYTLNNPVNYVDPSGNAGEPIGPTWGTAIVLLSVLIAIGAVYAISCLVTGFGVRAGTVSCFTRLLWLLGAALPTWIRDFAFGAGIVALIMDTINDYRSGTLGELDILLLFFMSAQAMAVTFMLAWSMRNSNVRAYSVYEIGAATLISWMIMNYAIRKVREIAIAANRGQ